MRVPSAVKLTNWRRRLPSASEASSAPVAALGRGFRGSFDACAVVAMRNANVYFDMTDSHPEHVREAMQRIGHERIMFGTDLSGISVNYAYEEGFHILDGAKPNAEELEWIAWRTVNEVYQLGLG